MFKKENLFTTSAKTKNEVLKDIANHAKKLGITASSDKLYKDLLDRETQVTTGFEDGITIPHTQSSNVKTPAVIVAKFASPVEWNSMDGKPANVSISLLVPKDSASDHLKILSKLAECLLVEKNRKTFKTGSADQIAKLIESFQNEQVTESKEDNSKSSGDKVKIVAVTSCAMGIAHTYMAAKALEKAAAEMPNISIKVERRGSAGKDNALTEKDIAEADIVLLAADMNVDASEFPGKKVYHVGIHEGLKHSKEVIEESLTKATLVQPGGKGATVSRLESQREGYKKSWVNRHILSHLTHAVSKIVPLMLAAGLLIGIARLTALACWGSGVEQVLMSNWGFLGFVYDPTMMSDPDYLASAVSKVPVEAWVAWNPSFEQYIINVPDANSLSGYVRVIDWGAVTAASGYSQQEIAMAFYDDVWYGLTSTGAIMLSFLNSLGTMCLWLMIPFWGIFVAKSIGGNLAFIPGLIVGILAQPDRFFSPIIGNNPANAIGSGVYPFFNMPSGIFGALFGGFFIGWVVKLLNDHIKIKNENYITLKTMFIIPLLSSFIAAVSMLYVIGPIFGLLNKVIVDSVITLSEAGASMALFLSLAAIIAFLTAFDLGGPINKAASSIAFAVVAIPGFEDFGLTARTLSIIIPPIGLGLMTMFDKPLTGKTLFSKEEKINGKTSTFLGFIAISEGGLPFLFRYPLMTVVSTTSGAIIGSLIAVGAGAVQSLPLPAIWGWPLVHENSWAYFVGLAVGVTWIVLVNVYWRYFAMKFGNMERPDEFEEGVDWAMIWPNTKEKSIKFGKWSSTKGKNIYNKTVNVFKRN